MARQSLAGLFEALRNDNNLPAYYVLLHFWIGAFGESEVALRVLSAAFYLGGGAAAYALGIALYRNQRAAGFAALLYLASAQVARQAQGVRMYTMLGFLAAGSLLLFFKMFVEEGHSRKRWLALILLNSIGMLTHVWFFFVLLGQFFYLVLHARRVILRFVMSTAVCGTIFVAAWGAGFLDQLRNGSTRWMKPFQLSYLSDAFAQFYGGAAVGLVLLAAAALPLLKAPRVREFLSEQGTRLALISLASCILTPLAISVVKPIYWPARYTTVGLPALAVFLGAILGRFSPRMYALGLCYTILIMTTVRHIGRANLPEYALTPEHSDQAAAEYIRRHAQSGDAIIFTNLTRTTADYYFRRFGIADRFVEISYPKELDTHPGWIAEEALLQKSDILQVEADNLVSQLSKFTSQGKRVWLYYGLPAVSGHLKQKLDENPGLAERHEIPGPFHSELLVYGAASPLDRQAVAR